MMPVIKKQTKKDIIAKLEPLLKQIESLNEYSDLQVLRTQVTHIMDRRLTALKTTKFKEGTAVTFEHKSWKKKKPRMVIAVIEKTYSRRTATVRVKDIATGELYYKNISTLITYEDFDKKAT